MQGFSMMTATDYHRVHTAPQNAQRAKVMTREYNIVMMLFICIALLFPTSLFAAIRVANSYQEVAISAPAAQVASEQEVVSSNADVSSEISVTVQQGDTLWALAGPTQWQQACRMNSLANCNLIFIGQRLQLPGKTKL